ncbi:MATE family efflux transporter [Photobacterium lipolyticum]|uniref:Multidrug resistance protein NorM n=1 Tax=Photobacterium lipolyticum TaxID=266810 RepID=A0A2T3N1T7_9GAMM|nr:MATE family efflux transporter [Photobacterium lipolyticum]PSW06195.1 MATE family efflux transporter [Photobacterium lipolyticum]
MQNWRTAADKEFWNKTWRLAIPVSMQSMLFAVLGLVDIMMVSKLGESQIAAVGVGNRIFFFNLLMIIGVSGAVGVLAAQFFGAGRMDGVRRTLLQSWLCAVVFTIPFAFLYRLAPDSVVSLITNDPAFVEHATTYLFVCGWSIIFTAIVVPLESALRAVGVAKMPTVVGLIAVLINALLNALLIFGLYGFPEMGVAGAALGTTISRGIQTVVLLLVTYRKYNEILPKAEDLDAAIVPKARKKYLSVALPMIIHDGGWAMGLLVYNYIIGQLGVTELAIISLLSPIEGVLISGFIGFAVAASTILGHELGAENYQRAWHQSWWFVGLSASLALLLGMTVILFQDGIGSLLAKTEAPNMEMAINVTLVLALGLCLKVFNMVGIGGVLRSGGDIRYSIFIDLFAQWGVGIPLAIFTGIYLGWPLHWVMLAILTEELVKVVLTTHRIRGRHWLTNLINDESPDGDKECLAA